MHMIRWKMNLLLVTGLIFLVVATTWSGLRMMSVQVKNGQLRNAPSFLGALVAQVAYGDQVEVLQQQEDWLEVKISGNRKGWIHQSAVTATRVVLSGGGQKASSAAASKEELALAGKGFNADVEAKFKAGHRDIDFTWVNRMEAIRISRQEMISFLKSGGVQSKEGDLR